MLARIGSVENIPSFLAGVKNKKEKMKALKHLEKMNAKYAKMKAPKLREELSRRGLEAPSARDEGVAVHEGHRAAQQPRPRRSLTHPHHQCTR